ncbi:MAG: serine hydrolase domain-containing protein [Ginsengibacter sp.]
MSYKFGSYCRKFSLILPFMLYFQATFSQNSFSGVDTWLKENLNDLGGRAVLLILKDGKIVYEKAENALSGKQRMVAKFIARKQGKDANEVLKDYTIETHGPIASSSKWLSAALVMTFVDEGKLSLEDTIGKFLPAMTQHQKGGIKLWQCLSHLTAIDGGSLKKSREIIDAGNSMDDVMQRIAQQPMEGEPGKVFHYSSIGLQIAAAVIEKISGKDFKTLFKERIADPCEMKNTDFGNKKIALAAGDAYSTPADYIRFLQMILQNGMYNGQQVLSERSVALMQHNYAKGARVAFSPAEAGNWGYGLGEWVMDNAADRSLSVTSPGLFGSFPWVDNERQYAAFLFVFNLKQKGRNKKYLELKKLIDDGFANGKRMPGSN